MARGGGQGAGGKGSAQRSTISNQRSTGKASRGGFDPSDILAALNRARVRYMVVGGLAVILHGVDRHTWDLDLAVELVADNLKALEKALRDIGFERRVPAPIEGLADPRTRRLWTRDRNMRVYSFHERTGRSRIVDVMVEPLGDFDHVYRRRVIARARGVSIPLVPVDVLIQLKQAAGRPQDVLDIANLKRLSTPS